MSDMVLTFIILGVTILLFVLDRLRLDIVALISLLALSLTGLVTVEEALAGFSDSIVIIIAGLFVVGAGIYYTGVANEMGRILARLGGSSEVRILIYVMLLVALLSAFMSSTGAVAVLLPVVMSLAKDARIAPGKLLMPLAFGALIGGMLTLIGTPPNLVVSNQLASLGMRPFSFFSFTPIGLIVLIVGIAYMAVVGRGLLGRRAQKKSGASQAPATSDGPTLAELAAEYQLDQNSFRLRVRRASPFVNQTLANSNIGHDYNVEVLERQSWPDDMTQPLAMEPVTPDTVIRGHDILHVRGTAAAVARLCREQNLGIRSGNGDEGPPISRELGMAEVIVRNRSPMIGKTLEQLRFRNRYNLNVSAIMRRGEPVHELVSATPLRFGDTLLVEGAWSDIEALQQDRSFVIVLDVPQELETHYHTRRNAFVAIAIVVAMLLLMTLKIVPTVIAVLLAAVAMVLLGCIRVEDVYRSINWESVILIAAMLPMATALENSGGVEAVADLLVNLLGQYGPAAIMAGLFVITAFFSQFISNTATTVLLAPIAAAAAVTLGLSPYPLLMMVAIAASTAFATPISSPVNTLVMVPGGYRFMDYAKVGIPLQVLVLVVALLTIPIFFPY
ncbi:MAG: SLC13 family permease [Caldilineaceae bacterium]|nr:SLC13 family permease [Caldilineaceae bacterium]